MTGIAIRNFATWRSTGTATSDRGILRRCITKKKARCVIEAEIEGKAETIEAALKALEMMKELHPGVEFEMKLHTESFQDGNNKSDYRGERKEEQNVYRSGCKDGST